MRSRTPPFRGSVPMISLMALMSTLPALARMLPDETLVTTTYGQRAEGNPPDIVSMRFTLAELDEMAKQTRGLKAKGEAPFAPTRQYKVRTIEGWRVRVNQDLLRDQPELAEEALTLLRHQLFQVARRVPAAAVERLRTIRIWVEENEPHHRCMAYHPNVDWLREHGMNPDKARCVEVANVRNFLKWTIEQPYMVLHELAHGYHDQFLDQGFDHPAIASAYRRAKEAGSYASVLHFDGQDDPAYALNNPMEYFAEASEAFFGTNDFYPFVRAELQRHDPVAYRVLKKVWNAE